MPCAAGRTRELAAGDAKPQRRGSLNVLQAVSRSFRSHDAPGQRSPSGGSGSSSPALDSRLSTLDSRLSTLDSLGPLPWPFQSGPSMALGSSFAAPSMAPFGLLLPVLAGLSAQSLLVFRRRGDLHLPAKSVRRRLKAANGRSLARLSSSILPDPDREPSCTLSTSSLAVQAMDHCNGKKITWLAVSSADMHRAISSRSSTHRPILAPCW